ncbi:VanZ family protein [Streptomonospora algeriensis]|uniref:VanZ family protein n=1 Tax=Streptomonospora algeriensis TaxID=995084 RepID=A0ABW3BB43_9ACTN
MTELTNSVDVPVFMLLVTAASCVLAVLANVIRLFRGRSDSKVSWAFLGLVSGCYMLAAVLPWRGWQEIGTYPPRVVLGIGEALSYSGAAEKTAAYGVLFLPLGIAVAAAARGYKAILAIGSGFPLAAEAAQALLGTARLASVTDYLAASTGVFLGAAVFLLARALMHRPAGKPGGSVPTPAWEHR